MKRTAAYVALGLVAYLVFAATTLPAQKALGFAQSQLEDQGVSIAASGVTGSAWSGRAASLDINGVGLQQVRWDLDPVALLGGRVGGHWDVSWRNSRLQGYGSATTDGRTLLRDITGRSPVAAFSEFLPNPIDLAGDLTLDLRRLELVDGRPVAADGSLVWSGAALMRPLEATLGNIRVTLQPRKAGGIDALIRDAGGPLRLEGQLELDPDGAYRLDALLGTRPGADPVLEENLPMLGRRTPDGRYRVIHEGRI